VKHVDVLVVGAGLSGCLVASQLATRGIDFQLIEARDRPGGRILSQVLNDDGNQSRAVDLGPSWLWPHQRSLIELIRTLGLEKAIYEQSYAGASVIEYANGQLEQRNGAVSMAGSYRIDGGMQTLIDSVMGNISPGNIHYGTRLTSIIDEGEAAEGESVIAQVETKSGSHKVSCNFMVLALPPRLVADQVDWPAKDQLQSDALESVATWMATEAKLTLIYDKPFWLQQGLSGDAMSQIGPLGEIHDATPRNNDQGALFGFLVARPSQRFGQAEAIKQQAVEQVQRMFNTDQTPDNIFYKDWSVDSHTATGVDYASERAHPSATALQQAKLGKRVIWAASETATQDPGYLEGAVSAANDAIRRLTAMNN